MLVEQGALAFERWFGVAPDRAAMWEAIGARRVTRWTRGAVVARQAVARRRGSLDLLPAAQLRRLRAAARSRRARDGVRPMLGSPARCCRRRAAIGADIRRDGNACRWCELLPPTCARRAASCWATGERRPRHRPRAQVPGVVSRRARHGRAHGAARLAGRRRRGAMRRSCPCRCRRSASGSADTTRASIWRASWRAAGTFPCWNDVLARTRHTETQTRLTPGDRLRNVSGAFRARPTARRAHSAARTSSSWMTS